MKSPTSRLALIGALALLNLALLSAKPLQAAQQGPEVGTCGLCWNDDGRLAYCCQYGCGGQTCCTTAGQCVN